MNVKELKAALSNIPDNADVVIHIAANNNNSERYERADDLLWSPISNSTEIRSDGIWED